MELNQETLDRGLHKFITCWT